MIVKKCVNVYGTKFHIIVRKSVKKCQIFLKIVTILPFNFFVCGNFMLSDGFSYTNLQQKFLHIGLEKVTMLIKSITLRTTCIYIYGTVIFCNRSIESLKENHLMQIYFCKFLTIVMTAQGTSNGSATVENDLCSLKDWCWHLRYLLLRGYLE